MSTRGVTTIFSTNNIAPQSLSYAGNDFALAFPDAEVINAPPEGAETEAADEKWQMLTRRRYDVVPAPVPNPRLQQLFKSQQRPKIP